MNRPGPSSRVAGGPGPSKLMRARCSPVCVYACAWFGVPPIRLSDVGGGEVVPHAARAAGSAAAGGAVDCVVTELVEAAAAAGVPVPVAVTVRVRVCVRARVGAVDINASTCCH